MEKVKFSQLSEDRQWDIVEDAMSNGKWYDDIIQNEEESLNELGFEGVEIQFSGFWSQGDGASFTADNIDFNQLFEKMRAEIGFESPALEDWLRNSELRDSEAAQFLADHGFAHMFEKPTLLILLEEGFFNGSISRHNFHYVHEMSTSVEIDCDSYTIVDDEDDRSPKSYDITISDEKEIDSFIEHMEKWITTWMQDKNRKIYRDLEQAYERDKQALYEEYMEDDNEFLE